MIACFTLPYTLLVVGCFLHLNALSNDDKRFFDGPPPLELFAWHIHGKWYKLPAEFAPMIRQLPNCRRIYSPYDLQIWITYYTMAVKSVLNRFQTVVARKLENWCDFLYCEHIFVLVFILLIKLLTTWVLNKSRYTLSTLVVDMIMRAKLAFLSK